MRQLTGQDTIYLNLEGDETVAHVTALMLMDQSTALGKLVTFKQILQRMEERLRELPVLKQKLVRVPFQLDYPFLADDPDFDLEFHVRHIALPKPGDWRQLCIQAARIHARGLDLTKPLWEMYVIEGVDHTELHPAGSFAVLLKIHHALVDGGAFTQMMSILLDTSSKPKKRYTKAAACEPAPSTLGALSLSLTSAAKRPFAFAIMAAKLAPRYLIQRISKLDERRLRKPHTRFNRVIGPHRVVEGKSFDLQKCNQMRKLESGATLNDVVVAICGGALRHYLLEHGGLPDSPLIAGVPVNLNPNRQEVSENDIALLQLPVHSQIDSPLERLRAVHESAEKVKAQSAESGIQDMGELSKNIPAPLLYWTTSLLYETRLITNFGQLFNLVITNVPGPQKPMYFCGAQLCGLYGLAPLAHTLGLVITQFSYNGRLYFGICSDREMMPDPAFFVECLEKSWREYSALL